MECVAGADRCFFQRSCREFEDGAGPKATRQAPWWHAASHFSDYIPAIEKDEIDSKAHPEGMHRLARHDPQALAFTQGAPAEQAPRAGRPAVGYIHPAESAFCSEIANLTADARIGSPRHAIACYAKLPEPERDVHSEWPA
jgi:hypothetical protein